MKLRFLKNIRNGYKNFFKLLLLKKAHNVYEQEFFSDIVDKLENGLDEEEKDILTKLIIK